MRSAAMIRRCFAFAAFVAISSPIAARAVIVSYTFDVPIMAARLPMKTAGGVPITYRIACLIKNPMSSEATGTGMANVPLDVRGTFAGTHISMSMTSEGLDGTSYQCTLQALDRNSKPVPNAFTGTGTVSGPGNFPGSMTLKAKTTVTTARISVTGK
jgi:hypothetical protein